MREVILETAEGKLEVEWFQGLPYIHLQLSVWSIEAFKEYKRIWKDVKQGFKDAGHDTLYVIIPNDDDKLLKFEKMFGFSIIAEINNTYLMSQEI